MTPSTDEVRAAIVGMESYYGDNIDDDMTVTKWFKVLVSLAQSLLDAGAEFPKAEEHHSDCWKMEDDNYRCDCGIAEYNNAIAKGYTAYLSLMAKKDEEIRDLLMKLVKGEDSEYTAKVEAYTKLESEYNKLAEEKKTLEKEVSTFKFFYQFTPEQCRYLESTIKSTQEEISDLKRKLEDKEKWNENVETCSDCGIHWKKIGKQCPVCYAPAEKCKLEERKVPEVEEIEKVIQDFVFVWNHTTSLLITGNFAFKYLATAIVDYLKKGEK